jgi:hypothetical protein
MEQSESGHLAAPGGDVPAAASEEAARPVAGAAPTEQEAQLHTRGELVTSRTFATHDHPTRYWRTYIDTDRRQSVAETFGATQEEAEENARRIVQCWNAHDSLLALLKKARTHLPLAAASWNEEPQYKCHVDAVLALIGDIDAALANVSEAA